MEIRLSPSHLPHQINQLLVVILIYDGVDFYFDSLEGTQFFKGIPDLIPVPPGFSDPFVTFFEPVETQRNCDFALDPLPYFPDTFQDRVLQTGIGWNLQNPC